MTKRLFTCEDEGQLNFIS